MHNQALRIKNRKRFVAAIATVFVAAAMAGCLDTGDDGGDQRESDSVFEPVDRRAQAQAALAVDKDEGWIDESFTFDASNSSATGAEITSWRFEFGDGTSMEVNAPDEPVVQHNYSAGGLYTVNLTVEAGGDGNATQDDDAADDNQTADTQDRVTDSTMIMIAVHDEQIVPETGLDTGLGGNTDSEEHPFSVNEGATNFTVTLELEGSSPLLIGSSEGTVRVLDASGETIAEQEFSLSDGEEETLTLSGDFNATGDHTLEVELEEGALDYEGTIVVYYAAGADSGQDATDENDY